MKKYFIATAGLALTLSIVFLACTKKNDSNAITPTYKEEATGTGGNPTKDQVTVTGSNTMQTNPASNSSSINTSNVGFTFPTCASTSSLALKALNGSVDVTVSFALPPTTGVYQVGPGVGNGMCTVVVNNAPNQPAGVVWYGKTGSVSVSTSTNGISAVLNSVQCTQATFQFPQVVVTGNMSCN